MHASATQAPVEYWGGGCGAIVLWTRRDPKLPRLKKLKKEKPKSDSPGQYRPPGVPRIRAPD